ncbi:DUF2805 domain-containing protein [Arenibacter sp. N53]|nr:MULTISPECIES: DUF2805 domain-containing protein [Arenibacter]MCM4151208.1 DUF2805 domain-containing protein [Arenibacter sp. N53]
MHWEIRPSSFKRWSSRINGRTTKHQ